MELLSTHLVIYLIVLLICAIIGTLVAAMQKFKNSEAIYSWSLILSVAIFLAIEGSFWILYFVFI